MTFSNGQYIVKQGDINRRMFIILEGSVDITSSGDDGETVQATIGKREFFGETSLYNSIPRRTNVIAKEDTKVTYLDSVSELNRFLAKNPKFAQYMIHTLTQRMSETDILLQNSNEDGSGQTAGTFIW